MIKIKVVRFFLLVIIQVSVWSCNKKNNALPSGGSALTIINAVVNSNSLVTNFTPNNSGKGVSPLQYYQTALQISYGSYQELPYYSGSTPLSLSPITDTTYTVWSGTLDLSINTIHSLFLTGADTAHVDTLFTIDHPPVHPLNDSTVGIRFVNLSPGSNPVSIDIAGNTNGSENPGLSYKGISGFKSYPTNAESTSLTFEFRDATSGTLLATYKIDGLSSGTNGDTSPNNWRYRNITIALLGLPNAQGTILIPNY